MMKIRPFYGQIYLLTNTANGKRYVGQTTMPLKVRIQMHFAGARSQSQPKYLLYRALNKYGKEGFKVDSLGLCYSKSELDLLEDLYIVIYDTLNRAKGYNVKRGGGRGTVSEEIKDRIRKFMTGKKFSPEHCINIGLARKGEKHPNYGKSLPIETRIKMSISQKRRPHESTSEETKKKISQQKIKAGLVGERSASFHHNVSTLDLVHPYETHSTYELGKMFSLSPSAVGRRLVKADVTTRINKKSEQQSIKIRSTAIQTN